MSGHSKWSTIRRKKGKADAARGKLFSRLIREITVAVRERGGDESANPRLRTAIQSAKGMNMPQNNIERAIKRGTGELPGVSYEEAIFEGYGPGGVAVMIEVLTDNRKRTVSELRHIFSKHQGSLAESGSVVWMFEQQGLIAVDKNSIDEYDLIELVLEAGAEDIRTEEDAYEVITSLEHFGPVKRALDGKATISQAELVRTSTNLVKVTGKTAEQTFGLLEAIEEQEDVQNVSSNLDIDEKELATLLN